jgi:uncharacterized membrane protein YvbJ
MYCYKCGKEIDSEAVVCIHCGVSTKNNNTREDHPIIINNSASSSSAATAQNNNGGFFKKGHSIILWVIFGGFVLWIPAIYFTISPNHYWHL